MHNRINIIWSLLVIIAVIIVIVALIDPKYDVNLSTITIGPFSFKIGSDSSKSVSTSQDLIPANQTAVTKVSRENRDWQHVFKNSATHYNVFETGEIKNVYKVELQYSSKRRHSNDPSCAGTREVYVRSEVNEKLDVDSQWIKVGEFKYDSEEQSVHVVIDWEGITGPQDVYSMAIVIKGGDPDQSFSADWGEDVKLYSYVD